MTAAPPTVPLRLPSIRATEFTPIRLKTQFTLSLTTQKRLLPEEIRLLNEKSTNPIFTINVQDAYSQKAFKNGNQLELDVKNLPRGTYYLHIINSKRKDLEKDIIRLMLE